MNLDEAFLLHDDLAKLKRQSWETHRGGYTVEWLKGLKAWGTAGNRKMGFIIPQFMIDDAQADDWEVIE